MSDGNDRVFQLLAEIQAKLNAPALNGWFETLMYKVDKIEETQDKILEEVSALSDTIYDPDNGIFARIKSVENADLEELHRLEKDFLEMQSWKESEKKKTEELHSILLEKQDKIREMERQIEDLTQWKASISGMSRWAAITIGGGGVSMLIKVIYDYLSCHIHFS